MLDSLPQTQSQGCIHPCDRIYRKPSSIVSHCCRRGHAKKTYRLWRKACQRLYAVSQPLIAKLLLLFIMQECFIFPRLWSRTLDISYSSYKTLVQTKGFVTCNRASKFQISCLARTATTLGPPWNKHSHSRAAHARPDRGGRKALAITRQRETLSTREEVKSPHPKATSERKVCWKLFWKLY